MNRVEENLIKFNRTKSQLIELEEEYRGKKRGQAYEKRQNQLSQKAIQIVGNTSRLGTDGLLWMVKGVVQVPKKDNKNIFIQKPFRMYLTNISEDEANGLTKYHVKNLVSYEVIQISLGVLIT